MKLAAGQNVQLKGATKRRPQVDTETARSADPQAGVASATRLPENGRREFLAEIVVVRPADVTDEVFEELRGREAVRAAELAALGHLIRIWRPGDAGARWMNVGLWSGADREDVMAAIDSLPLRSWMAVSLRELNPHPNDPPH